MTRGLGYVLRPLHAKLEQEFIRKREQRQNQSMKRKYKRRGNRKHLQYDTIHTAGTSFEC